MEFKILVTFNGKHLFTAENINSLYQMEKAWVAITRRFKREDGYEVELQKWERKGICWNREEAEETFWMN